MIKDVEATVTRRLADEWILRGILVESDGSKKCVAEKAFSDFPSEEEIAKFLLDHEACEFCTLIHNYRII